MEKLPSSACTGLQIADIQIGDIPALTVLHQQTDSNPWNESSLNDAFLSSRYRFLGIKHASGELIGFAIFYLILDDIELHKIAIAPNSQQQGLGYFLLQESLLLLADFERCFLEVRESNLAAIRLYQKLGFEVTATRPNYYSSNLTNNAGKESALLMQYKQKLD